MVQELHEPILGLEKAPHSITRRQQHGPAYGQGGKHASQEPGSRHADAGHIRQHHPDHVLQQEGIPHRHGNPGGGDQQLMRQRRAHPDSRAAIDIIKKSSVKRSGHQGGGIILQSRINQLPVIHILQEAASERPDPPYRQKKEHYRQGKCNGRQGRQYRTGRSGFHDSISG